ncbi:phage tail tape measure protein, partial [Bacillus wiedmannii]|uniref:phage tail tape measure protein n=1 Tax=Bacillus wiedmannii TaxID=1890302 RepID=UPI0025A14CC2
MANEINNLVVRLSLDNVDFRQGIATSGRAVKTLQNELKSVSTGMGGFANASDQTRAKVDVLNRIIEAQKEKVKSLRAAYDQNKAKLGENDAATQRYAAQVNRAVADLNRFENELKQVNRQADQKGIDKLSNTMKALQAELQSVSTGMGGFANRSEQAHAKVDVLNRMVDTQRQKVQQLSDAYNRSQQAEGATSQSTQRYAEQLHRATTELNRFETELQQANRHLDEQSNRMMNTGRHLETMGNNLQNAGMQIGLVFGGMAYAMGRGLKSAVQESMNFEQQMANIKAVSGATGTEMETLSKLAVKYGEDTKYSSVEAGKGIEELIKAGVSLTDIINGGLEGALNLASAGELELGEAAEIASTALNAFKRDGLSVTDAANLLAGAANASATDVHELKYGLSASAAVAAGAGMTFKDTATALAVFAQNGLKGSDAGTSLKTMLMRLNPSTKEAYNKMKDLGLITYNAQAGFDFLVKNGIQPASRNVGDIEVALEKYVMKTEGVTKWNDKCDTTFRELATSSAFLSSKFYDQEGHIESLENISGTLNESMKDLTDQQRSMALETLFGSDAVRGATILFNEGAKGVNNMYSEMSKTTALETAETKMNTMKGRIEQLGGAFDTMKKTIGDALMPVVSTMVGGLQFLVDGFNNLSPSVQKFISISAGVIFGLTAIAAVGATILAGIGGVIAGVGILTTSIASAGGVVAILGTAFAALTGPVGLTVLGIAGATTAIGYFINESQKASEETSKFGGRVSEGTRQAAGAYIDLKDKAINNMIDLKLKTGAEANKAADETIKAFQRMTNEVIKELEGKKSEFNKMFSQLMGSVPEGAQKTLEQVKNNVIESINKEIEVATQAETILEEGIKRYQGDTMKMPKDFAQKFDQALQVADKNVQQFYSKAKEITSISKEIESGGMLSVDAGRKRFESIIKVYDDGVKSLEKQTKGWRENVEKAFKMGEIKPEERKATLDAIALYEAKHVSDLQTIRGDGFKKLEEHLKAEDASLVFANANKIEAEKKGWAEKTKAYLFGKETYEEVSNRFNSEQEKAEKEHKDKLLAFELQYGNSKIESIGMYVGELQKGTESSRLLAESMAREIDGKMKIDLGPAGQFTIDTFLDKMKKGEIDSNAVATANVNKLKDVYKVDLSQSGIESMQKWIDGIKTKDTSQVREFLNKNMQGDTTIDLGIYGKMTMDSWITGLQNGTLSFDTVFQFFQQNVKNGVKV